jgi:hypothetical protein
MPLTRSDHPARTHLYERGLRVGLALCHRPGAPFPSPGPRLASNHYLTVPRYAATSRSPAKRLAIPDEASPFALCSTRNSSEDSNAGMRSKSAMRRRGTGATAIKETNESVSARQTGVVGLAGLEPAASSLSGIEGSALCGPAFPQVAGDRKGRRDAFLLACPCNSSGS